MKNIDKKLTYVIIAVLFLFNIYFLVLNNKNVSADSLNSLIVENVKLKQVVSHRQQDFSNLLSKHYSFLEGKTNKKLIFYVPQAACGICLEKIFNKYWDTYLEKIPDQILVLFEDENVSNNYYMSERLVESQFLDSLKGSENNKIIIFFNVKNGLFYPVTFDLNLINYIEPYFNRYLQSNI